MKKNTVAFDEIEHIQEINNHISDALEQWANITTMADADEWAYLLSYSDVDCFNVIRLFFHVLSNRAIKDGILTEENTMGKITKFKETLHDTFGFDTIELTKKILHGTETN